MDAVKFLQEYERMCKSYGQYCDKCGINKMRNGDGCTSVINAHPEEAVAIVENWSAEHPVKTRQSEFLDIFPNAEVKDGYLHICPGKIDQDFGCDNRICSSCLQKYWLAEVER